MSEEIILRFFAGYIENQLGIIYSETNYFQLSNRLKVIAQKLGLRDISELYAKASVSIDGQFKNLLLDLATNNETSFYRDAHIFKALGDIMIPSLLKQYGKRAELSVWSAAASSGQEIYTIAMEMDKLQNADPAIPDCIFFASDISDTILKRAQEGIYSQLEVDRGLPKDQLIEYFNQIDEGHWQVKDRIRKKITFRKINLLEYWSSIGPLDIIFCRNVLIYQSVENKQKVVKQILQVLRPGGFLVLGAAESMFGVSEAFEQVTEDKTIIYRKKV